MLEEGIVGETYVRTTDNTLQDLHNFQCVLNNNFSKHKDYADMRPTSNQPARLFATAKTHKFDKFDDINIEELKVRPIVDQTGTHTHPAGKVIYNL